MLYKFVYYIFKLFPNLKQLFWKRWYNIFAKKILDNNLKFMNYGYYSNDLKLNLNINDEKDRYTIQLYHHVSTQINLKNLNVLEIGSGRGGGCSYIARYLEPKHITGIDLSHSVIKLCNSIYNIDNLNFVQGNAENLPFKNNQFDVIINIESSHCYTSMNKFIKEVSRVLKPEGYFLFCDLRRDIYIKELLSDINSNGLSILSYANISKNIISATEKMSNDRELSINKLNIGVLKNIIKSFAAIKGSNVHQSFKKGYLQYISAICKNKK